MTDLLKQFEDLKGYTIAMIAKALGKSENYVARRLKEAGITPEGEMVTAMGPNSKVWKGKTIKNLIRQNVFGVMNVGEILWYDSKRTRVYLIKFYLNVDGKRIPTYKVGITEKEDIVKGRFKEEVSSGLFEQVEVLADVWFDSRPEAEAYETSLFNLVVDEFGGYQLKDGSIRFHNFYTKQQPKGITEMRSLNVNEVDRLIQVMNEQVNA